MKTETTKRTSDALDDRIASARLDFDDKLAEVKERLTFAREKLSSLDDIIGTNPWVRLGLSTAAGVAIGLVGRRLVRTGFRFGLALGAKQILRYAFDTAFDAGQRDGVRLAAADQST